MHAKPDQSSVSRWDTYKQVEKSRGVPPVELLNAPELPWQCGNAWGVFSCMQTVTYSEIKAYTDVTGDILDWWEVELLIIFDRLRRSEPTWPPK